MEMSDAMIEAHDALFDYSMVPRSVARARVAPLGIPFLTFYYKVLPRLAKVAITDPLRFAPYVGVAWALQEMIQGAYDVDDDDLRKLREALPRWVRERGHALLLPWKDQHGRWQVIDLGYMVPWGMFADVATQVGEGEYRRALATVGILSGPIPDLIAALQSGIDTFTGKEIADPGAPAAKQLEQMLVYLWNLAVPPILAVDDPVTGQAKGPTGALIDAVSGRVNPRTREPGLTVAQAAGRMFGLSIYPVNPEVSRMQNIRAMHAELREMQATMKDRLRDPNLTKEDRQEVRRVWIELIRRQQRMIRQYSEDSRVPERLLRTPAEGADAA
jgi:hypothetical protein